MGHILAVDTTAGTFYGRVMSEEAGNVYAIAGSGTRRILRRRRARHGREAGRPLRQATDGAGNVVFADRLNQRVRVVANASGMFYGQAMAAGHIYTIAGNGTSGDTGNGGLASSAELSFPTGVGVDGHGNVLIADGSNNQIRAVAASTGTFYGQAMTAGHIYTIAGTGTSGYTATVAAPPPPNWTSARPRRWTAPGTWSSRTTSTPWCGSWPPPPGRSTA